MVALRTEITEIVTGLALLGYKDLERALEVRPGHITNVTHECFDRLEAAYVAGDYAAEFSTSWANGDRFRTADVGLRGRPPLTVEWKGPHKPPGYETIPADLRVDHVYLISCKYGSSILHNVGPSNLFTACLTEKRTDRSDWFHQMAPGQHQELYRAYIDGLGISGLPDRVEDLDKPTRAILKRHKSPGRAWPGDSGEVYTSFAWAVAQRTAEHWLGNLGTDGERETLLWRLIRLQAAPYFVLGAQSDGVPTHYQVGTPWDFRKQFRLRDFDAWADASGQPLIRWMARVIDRVTNEQRSIEGHIEIRWSHGRFQGAPEAKVYLDTSPHQVAGYLPIS
jgi:hypothetical protein